MPSVNVPEPVPLVGETVSHELLEAADQASEPAPAFVMFTVCEAGPLPPSVKEKLAWLAESDSEGCGAALTVSVTEIVCGLFIAPEAVTVTVPL
jgi:hypothetical protein